VLLTHVRYPNENIYISKRELSKAFLGLHSCPRQQMERIYKSNAIDAIMMAWSFMNPSAIVTILSKFKILDLIYL